MALIINFLRNTEKVINVFRFRYWLFQIKQQLSEPEENIVGV